MGSPSAAPALSLADGAAWSLSAADSRAAVVCARLAAVLQLQPAAGPNGRRLALDLGPAPAGPRWPIPKPGPDGAVRCVLPAGKPPDELARIALSRLLRIVAWDSEARGGLLIHGALAVRPLAGPAGGEAGEGGVILAAPGGRGKSTACRRLPPPWLALSDDAALIVRDTRGRYWAHPIRNANQLFLDGADDSWDVQRAAPLCALFFLSQAPADHAEPVGAGQAASLLVQSVKQASYTLHDGPGRARRRAREVRRFDNVCALARAAPAYVLHISLQGEFWREIEGALAWTEEEERREAGDAHPTHGGH